MARSSSMFWFASSANEVARARAVLRAMKPQGVLDEMGFLVLLGAISDRLYPGISTIMTRARYFIFLPAIFRHIEERGLVKGRNADVVSRSFQVKLCLALMDTDPEDAGIIGKRNRGEVARPPSSVYWNALTVFGIATRKASESSYLASLSKRSAGRTITDDDGVQHEGDQEGFWSDEVPVAGLLNEKGDFAAGTSLTLSRAEAKYLRDCMLAHDPEDAPSLLGHLLHTQAQPDSREATYRYPWNVPGLSPELRRITDHAMRLSLLARGAQLQYDALLFEKRGIEDPGTIGAFTSWWEHRAELLRTWDLDDFWGMACVRNSLRDVSFLRTWRDAIVSHDSAHTAYSSRVARDRILDRERNLRGNKARFVSKFHLDEWEPPKAYEPDDHFKLAYRQSIGSRIVADIATPLHKARL
jgi:hypothetical protein